MRFPRKAAVLTVVILMLGLLVGIPGVSAYNHNIPQLRMYNSTVTWDTYAFEINPDGSLREDQVDFSTIVTREFPAIVVENAYLKATFVPDYGARLLSIVYKPTGHELLYQNPLGVPYGFQEGNFYNDWLIVWGGIFPTFPESEHGKYFAFPWEYEIVERTTDKISIAMRMTDKYENDNKAQKFRYGVTEITNEVVYTIYADKPYVEMHVKLINNKSEPVEYEYWTCTTLAPGSRPGRTVGSPSMEIVADLEKIQHMPWYRWLREIDEPIDPENRIYEFKNIAKFRNHQGMGISYGVDVGDWWGVINQDNKIGILRVVPNHITHGLKLWTWGFENSYISDPYTTRRSARPYLELWAGTSHEFFESDTLGPNEVKEWTEFYLPTVGLEAVTNSSKDAAVYLTYEAEADLVNLIAKVFTTEKELNVLLELAGEEILHESFNGDPQGAVTFAVPVTKDEMGEGMFSLTLTDHAGNVLVTAAIPVEV